MRSIEERMLDVVNMRDILFSRFLTKLQKNNLLDDDDKLILNIIEEVRAEIKMRELLRKANINETY
jgi:hypothetical protein